ncbi:MAG: biotin carboxylase N-terminal domain-containing protein [Actinomycetota bacterium]
MSSRRFQRILVANRGEIARRVFRTATAMGMETVAVFVDADADALFVSDADQAVRIDGYLDQQAIINAALATGAEAIHPGYGFLAENGDMAEAVEAAGLAWIGPGADAIRAMGDKIEAKKLAVEAGVPVLPSADDPTEFESIGFPLLIKAAAGGGGKGMRIVTAAEDLPDAIVAAQREAETGFGDPRVFAERYVGRARHIEIQIMGDGHGSLVHLGERECSIQRRHQKIIEEAPSPFVSKDMRDAMGEAALRLGAALGYRSAGTVEFLVDAETEEYFFLEVNTRLQVEHPVTEEVTGRDLVRDQLLVAMGLPLPYSQDDVTFTGHAIEARLYAEDPANDFLPATGTLEHFAPGPEPALRWDTGVRSGSIIGTDFDPMIAKVVAHGPDRFDAAGRLALGLERLHLDGVTTNRDFLSAVLRSPEYLAGDTTTDFIERVAPASTRPVDDELLGTLALWAALWLQGHNRAEATTLRSIPSGFVVGRIPPERVSFRLGDRSVEVNYRSGRDGTFRIGRTGERGTAVVHDWSPCHVDAEHNGRRATVQVSRSGDRLQLTGLGGGLSLEVVPRFPIPETEQPGGAIAAPMPGKVVELRVAVGDAVTAGQVVAVLEAMKMENHLAAAEDGVVTEIRVAPGDQVEKDVLLMVIETADEGAE